MGGDAEKATGVLVSSATIQRVRSDGVTFPPDTPWWAKLAGQFISMVGIPAAICAFLLYERQTVMHQRLQFLQVDH